MTSLDVRRYVIGETAISVAINILMDAGPAAIAFGIHKAGNVTSAAALVSGAAPQLILSGLMSALVPVLLTRSRCRKGRLWSSVDCVQPTVLQVFLLAMGMMIVAGALGAAFLMIVLPRIAGHDPSATAKVLFYGLYGAVVAVIVTPLALFLFYRRSWSDMRSSPRLGGVRRGRDC
jgi:hypothetical protein